jgi:hypothetical protein
MDFEPEEIDWPEKEIRMKNIISLSTSTILLTGFIGYTQAEVDLIYVAVDPCRIVDTRQASEGVIGADTFRNFLVAGTAEELAVQGGIVDCQNPKEDESPVAISAYILAVPAESSSGQGVLTAYPSDLPPPPTGSASTVNFGEGQVIGNTTSVTVCADRDCPDSGELAILARKTDEHVVVDVQGYFYPAPEAPVISTEIFTDVLELDDPEFGVGKHSWEMECGPRQVILTGGYSQTENSADVYGSAPVTDDSWKFYWEYTSGGGSLELSILCQDDL